MQSYNRTLASEVKLCNREIELENPFLCGDMLNHMLHLGQILVSSPMKEVTAPEQINGPPSFS